MSKSTGMTGTKTLVILTLTPQIVQPQEHVEHVDKSTSFFYINFVI